MLRKFPRSLITVAARDRLNIPCTAVIFPRCMSRSYEAFNESISQDNWPPPSLLTTSEAQNPTAGDCRVEQGGKPEERNEDTTEEPLVDFAALGIRKSVRVALHETFPSIRTPTACQTAFIPAVLSRKDVILKDWTGTGKSFGLVLALLSKGRATRPHLPYKERIALAKRPITSLIVVPHRDLAYQLMHWIRMLCPHNHQNSLDSIAQVCVRGSSAPSVAQQVTSLREQAPHILIGTPNGLLDILDADQSVLQIETLETVVVDEADYLLPVPAPGDTKKKHWNWSTHPPPTLRLLNALFNNRSKIGRPESPRPWRWPLQAVFASATLRHHLRRFFFGGTRWMDRYSEVVKIDFEREQAQNGAGEVRHYALIVDDAGGVHNLQVKEAIDDLKDKPSSAKSTPAHGDNAISAPLLEAVATVFALDVPRTALLVLPASTSVTMVLKELQDMGVGARALAMHDDDLGKYMIRSTLKKFNRLPQTQQGVTEEPTLLVSTEASIRGLDLPDLTHVFIVGVPETGIEYSHAAGRVGRFGRDGKVILFLEAKGEHKVVRESRRARGERVNEEERLRRMYAGLGLIPSEFEHVNV